MATVTGNEYDHITISDGTNNTVHYLKDTAARNNLIKVQSTQPTETENKLWITGETTEVQVPTYDEFTDLKSQITEETRNLNYAVLGHWGNAADGKIYSRGDTIVGMDRFIPVTGGNSYTFSFGGFPSSGMSWSYLFDDTNDTNVGRSGYANLNTRTITAPATATKVHAFCTCTSDLTITDDMYIQIEAGNAATEYIPPVSAIDCIVRKKVDNIEDSLNNIALNDRVGAMVDIAEPYYDVAYQNHKMVYQSQRGLFSDDIMSDKTGYTDCYAINCSQLATAIAKGITFPNSRYALGADADNHMQPWGYMTDGSGTYFNDNDRDYMQASEMFRYAENKGFQTYEITNAHPMVRPGDFVFAIDNNSEEYKKITHVAIVLSVGYDNGRLIALEAADNQNDLGGNPVGIRTIDTLLSTWKYGATYPVLDSPYKARLVYKNTAIGTTPETAGRIWSANISLSTGFHTFVIHGNITGNTLAMTFSGVSGNQYYRTMQNGNCIVLTKYIEKPVTWIGIYRENNTDYAITDFAIYKGYINPTTGIYGK